jgi:hypothetical protein
MLPFVAERRDIRLLDKMRRECQLIVKYLCFDLFFCFAIASTKAPTPSDSSVRQECCSPARRFRLPTQRSPAQPQSVQSWSSRSAPFPPESEPPIRSK